MCVVVCLQPVAAAHVIITKLVYEELSKGQQKINLKIVCFWQETSLSCLKTSQGGGGGGSVMESSRIVVMFMGTRRKGGYREGIFVFETWSEISSSFLPHFVPFRSEE